MQTDFLLPSVDQIRSYRKMHRREVDEANRLLGLEWKWCDFIIKLERLDPLIAVHVQTVHEYHRGATMACMRGRAGIAMALMRMACELARDVYRLVEKPDRVSLWLDRSEASAKKRREAFRFDSNHPAERHLFEAYKLFSTYGVHGHVHFSAAVGEVLNLDDKNFVMIQADPRTVDRTMDMILKSIHLYCMVAIERFKPSFDAEPPAIQLAYRELAMSCLDQPPPNAKSF